MSKDEGLNFGDSAVALVTLAATSLTIAGGAAADTSVPARHPLYMPDARNMQNPALQPPPICCSPVGPQLAGQPAPVNMAYFGGHVQVTPKIYLVFWGWGQPGAFDHTTPGFPANDPDGAAARMTAFVKALGGTAWAGSQTRYYASSSTARRSTSRTRRTSSAGSGTTTRIRSTTT